MPTVPKLKVGVSMTWTLGTTKKIAYINVIFLITFQLSINKSNLTYVLYVTPKTQWLGFVFIDTLAT